MELLVIFFAICFQIFLTYKKVSPFLSLLIVAITAGLLLGMPAQQLVKSIEKGVGSTLGGLALILCLGAVLGKILEASGAAEKIAITLIKKFGEKNIRSCASPCAGLAALALPFCSGSSGFAGEHAQAIRGYPAAGFQELSCGHDLPSRLQPPDPARSLDLLQLQPGSASHFLPQRQLDQACHDRHAAHERSAPHRSPIGAASLFP